MKCTPRDIAILAGQCLNLLAFQKCWSSPWRSAGPSSAVILQWGGILNACHNFLSSTSRPWRLISIVIQPLGTSSWVNLAEWFASFQRQIGWQGKGAGFLCGWGRPLVVWGSNLCIVQLVSWYVLGYFVVAHHNLCSGTVWWNLVFWLFLLRWSSPRGLGALLQGSCLCGSLQSFPSRNLQHPMQVLSV